MFPNRGEGGDAGTWAKFPTMSKQQASRTLLKSPPELWAECSDAQSLGRHLDAFFGEIRITRLEPESTVAWEGERGSGTVRLEPAGWGTRVTLTARPEALTGSPSGSQSIPPAHEPPVLDESHGHDEPFVLEEPPEHDEPPGSHRPALRPATFLARLLRRFGTESHDAPPQPVSATPPVEAQQPEQTEPPPDGTADVLTAALESLGRAHHRPYSRA